MNPPWLALITVCTYLGLSSNATAAPSPALSNSDLDALTRVAVAEAGNQGDSGLAAVVQTILNRLASGQWGNRLEQVVDAHHQFEPVARVGGDWRQLPTSTTEQRVRVGTIVSLITDGRLPDFVGGALYFQNPGLVAARAAAGTAPIARVNFGGQRPIAVIGAHAFYKSAGAALSVKSSRNSGAIFIDGPSSTPPGMRSQSHPSRTLESMQASPGGPIFILPDGRPAQDYEGTPVNP